jgi:hypothetical protein
MKSCRSRKITIARPIISLRGNAVNEFRLSQNTSPLTTPTRVNTVPVLAAPAGPQMKTDNLTLSARALDITEAAETLIRKFGAEQTIVQLVTVRGDDSTPAAKAAGNAKLASALGLKRALTGVELRDLDHFMTSYTMVQEAGNIKPDDGYAKRVGKTVLKEAMAVDAAVATVGYTILKGIGQTTGVDVLDKVSGGRYQSNTPTTSKASLSEIGSGFKGVWKGLIDS